MPMVQNAQTEGLPSVRYTDVRSQMQSGDLFFASGDYLFSKIVRIGTRSEWSHVGIVVRVPQLDRVLLLESVEFSGVRFAPLSKYFRDFSNGKPYKGDIAFAHVAGLDQAKLDALESYGLDQLARPYAYAQILRIMGRVLFGMSGRRPNDHTFVCSELVNACFAQKGCDIPLGGKAKKRNGYVSPRDIANDSRVKFYARVTP